MGNSKRNLLPEHAKWLKQATPALTSGSADRVCAEKQRYDSALVRFRERADPIAAESIAVSVAGDADTANFRYRRALLTRGLTAMEASILRQAARQRDFIVSHPWFLFLFLAVASASCVLASALMAIGWALRGRLLLALGLEAKLAGENVAIWGRMF
jgi:hypothetical protein